MTVENGTLGRSPLCEESIPAIRKLLEYEQEDGSTGVFAECPACTAVVRPE